MKQAKLSTQTRRSVTDNRDNLLTYRRRQRKGVNTYVIAKDWRASSCHVGICLLQTWA